MQHVQNDKAFVNISKMLDELSVLCRLEVMEAYRYQLFDYKVSNEESMNEEKQKIINSLNDSFENSKLLIKKKQNSLHPKKNYIKEKTPSVCVSRHQRGNILE